MYGPVAAGVSGAGTAGVLATAGLGVLGWTVAATTLLFAALALGKLLPGPGWWRQERRPRD
ncbi:hypothetical protein ACQKM2_38665 [Streptomyces sp. NPDC004126]|uniref:hypothetical protein n=1 Tax=Streptomyces sp. NPDC004126 TaxID=3390695 RepID=UPI003D07C6DB